MENNREFAQALQDLIDNAKSESIDNYEINDEQMEKFNQAMVAMAEIGGKLEDISLNPHMFHGGFSVRFEDMFYASFEELEKFKKAMQDFSAISIDIEDKKDIVMSFVVPDVFRKKDG